MYICMHARILTCMSIGKGMHVLQEFKTINTISHENTDAVKQLTWINPTSTISPMMPKEKNDSLLPRASMRSWK